MKAAVRNHFEAVARALDEDAQARRREALAIDPVERMRRGLRLSESTSDDPAIEVELNRRALGQAELHARWRRIARRRK
jgi:hypothetical protein